MADKKSDNFVEEEDGNEIPFHMEPPVEKKAPKVEKSEGPKKGPVYGRGDRGQLVIVEESDQN